MKTLFKFNAFYFLGFIGLLFIEIGIAKFLTTGFIRHTFGDFLVVILLYCFFNSFLKVTPLYIGLAVLAFSFLIEFLQLFHFLRVLHLENNHFATVVLGSTFEVSDLIAYTCGIVFTLIVESIYKHYGTT